MMRLAVYGQDEGGNQVNELSWWLLQKNEGQNPHSLTLACVPEPPRKCRRGIRVWRKGPVGPAEWVGW